MIESKRHFEAGLRPSPKLVAGLLIVLAWGINWFDLVEGSRVILFELFFYAMAGAIWLTAGWRPQLSRWLTVITAVAAVGLGIAWLNMSGFVVFIFLPVLLAAAWLHLPAAALTAIGETALLLLGARYGVPALDATTLAIFLAAIWIAFGTTLALYRPVYQTVGWFDEYVRQVQRWVEEERGSKVELKQALADLALANRELMLLNERVAAMRLIAEEAHKAKAAFVAKISHEFRTPLNMIIGLIDTLTAKPEIYEQEIPPALLEDLEIVHRNTTHLASMINDVLDLSQTETGKLQLHLEWADLGVDINNAVSVVQPLIEKKHLSLQLKIPADLPQVYYDRTRIRQVVLNLVSNAARYTDKGSITLEVGPHGNSVVVSVSDTGPGISPGDAERIFEPFYQGTTGQLRRDRDGSGLGLSVCQQLVTLHHGRIWLESQPGAGSTFFFELPISPRLPQTPSPKSRISEDWVFLERTSWPKVLRLPYRQRIVLCDETGALYPFFTHNFPDIEFIDAKNLAQTTEALHICPAHAVILNTVSPNDVAPLVEQARSKMPDTPVIGCSFPPQTNYILDAGASDYLIKPIQQLDLEKALQKVGLALSRILVVDDDPDILQLFARMLYAALGKGVEVVTAACGEEALDKLRRTSPDLMLLDIVMPGMDGWQVLAQKEKDESIRGIPVIIVSAEDPARQPMSSGVMTVAMGQGVSPNKLLDCSLNFSALLLQPAQVPGPTLE